MKRNGTNNKKNMNNSWSIICFYKCNIVLYDIMDYHSIYRMSIHSKHKETKNIICEKIMTKIDPNIEEFFESTLFDINDIKICFYFYLWNELVDNQPIANWDSITTIYWEMK